MRRLLAMIFALVMAACGGSLDEDQGDGPCIGEDCPCEGAHCEPKEFDDCLLVPAEGVCTGIYSFAKCVTDEKGSRVEETRCPAGFYCGLADDGAFCGIPRLCTGEVDTCTDEGNLLSCSDGKWVQTECPAGCTQNPKEASCKTPEPGMVLHRASIFYEHHVPAPNGEGWQIEVRPAVGLTVLSFRGRSNFDSATVREDGSFEILVYEEPTPGDALAAATANRLVGTDGVSFSVGNPELEPGMYPPTLGEDAVPSWHWEFADVKKDVHVIRKEHGSGAIQVFQAIRRSVEHLAGHLGVSLPSVSGWYHPGVDFTCGACFYPAQSSGNIFVSAGDFPAYRSDAILFHEAGHYVLPMMGVFHYESGQHCLGVPAPPGQALAEGMSHWYSADRRRDPRFATEQDGTFTVWNLDGMMPDQLFVPPGPESTPLDPVNETWVGAALWHLAKANGESYPLYRAIAAPELVAPQPSGYTAKRWMEVDEACRPVDPEDGGYPTPVLSDFLDALVCDGFPKEIVQSVVASAYPYDPFEPTCKHR